MTSERLALFETERISSAILKLAIPTVLSSLVMTLYSLADTFFVGMLNDSVQNAAVTLSAPVLLAFNAVNNLFGVGGSSMMSRALGRKDYQSAYKSSAFSFYSSILAGILFSSLAFFFNDQLLAIVGSDAMTLEATRSYLKWTVVYGATPSILNVVMAYLVRAEGSAMHASIGTMTGCLLNIVLDPLFVLPRFIGMGAEGALLNVTGMTLLNNLTSLHGADAVAAMGIAQRLNNVPFSIASGFTQGLMPLVSYNYAGGNYRRMKDGIVFSAKVVVSILVAIALSYFLFSDFFISIFMSDAEVVAYGTRFLHGFALGIPLLGIDFLAVAVFQAVGKGMYSFLFAITRKIVLEIPAIVVLNMLFPLYGLAYSQFTAEMFMSVIAVFTLTRLVGGLLKRQESSSPARNS